MDNRIKEALLAENNNKLVVIPTETVYGLSAPINDEEKIKKIFALKERPFFDPLIVHVENVDQAKQITSYFPIAAATLAKKYWPGPLTLVLPKANHVSDFITSGLQTVGVRIPKNQVTLDYIKALGTPIAAPSANKFGKTSPTCKEHVEREFSPETIYILDDGPSSVGIESTIVKIEALEDGTEQITVLRPGIISLGEIKDALAELKDKKYIFKQGTTLIEAPGTLKHHYAPKIPLRYYSSKQEYQKQDGERELVLSRDAYNAARELYAKMREEAETGAKSLYFIEQDYQRSDSHWNAILDRLRRAGA